MSVFSAYFLPPDDTTARSVALCSWAGGLLLPLWPKQEAWGFFGGATLTSGAGIISLSGSGVGYAAAATDAISGAWVVQYSGNLYNLTSGVALVTYTLPVTGIFTGCAYAPAVGHTYVINSSGQIYVPAGSGVAAVGTPFASPPAWGLVASGSSLITLLAASSGVGTFTLSSSGAGTSGFVATPMVVPTCLAASITGSGWAVGGWSYASLASGFTSLDFDPIVPTTMITVTPSTNRIGLYNGPGDVWTLTQVVTGTGAPTFVSFAPNGLYALATDPVSGKISVLFYSGGTLAVTGTLSLTDASALDINSTSVSALVCQPTQNQATAVNFTAVSGWAMGTAVTGLPSASSVVMTSVSTAAIGYASGVAYLNLVGTTWSVSGTTALAFTPKNLAVDVNGSLYAVGSQGASGFLSVLTNQALAATVTWPGSGTGVLWRQGQIVIGDPANSVLRIYGLTSGSYMLGGTTPAPGGLAAIGITTQTLFAAGSGTTLEYQFNAPYQLPQLRTGMVSVFTSGAFHTATLGVYQWPTALCYDASGNVFASTLQNTLYSISSLGSVLSSGAIGPIGAQPPTTPVGISAMYFFGNSLYAASSLYGALGVPSSTSFLETDTGFAITTDLGQEILV